MSLSPNSILAHYTIVSKIGAGGMGEVYLAQDTKLDRKVALKILPVELASNRDRIARFVREAKSAAALSHPNIAQIFEIGEDSGTHFIAMEFIDGQTLREKIHREHTELRKLLQFLQHVAEGLAKAHAVGVVHRDLKPENIMITRDGYAKILDFGLAKLIEGRGEEATGRQGDGETGGHGDEKETLLDTSPPVPASPTSPGLIMGTVGYMSPEQAQGKTNEIDQRSDIFSFGCILFEATTGKRPFEGKDTLDSLHKIVHAPTPQISEFNPGAPVEIQRILRRCLAKDPEKRYQSIKEVSIEIDELRQNLKAAAELDNTVNQLTAASSIGGSPVSTGSAIQSASATTQIDGVRTSSSAEYLVSQVKQHKVWTVLILTLAIFLVVGVSFGIYKFTGNKKTNISFEAAKFTRLTNTGKVFLTAISPDGKWLVYSTGDGGQQSLWLQQVAVSGSSTQIAPPAPLAYRGLAFSPDGNYVYFNQSDPSAANGTLYQVPVLGGHPRKVFTGIQTGLSFSPDGKQIAYYDSGDSEDRLMIANADGSGQRKLAGRRGNEYLYGEFYSPSWSPDGKTILTSVGTRNPWFMAIAFVSVETGEIKNITRDFGTIYDLTWMADGKSVLVLAQAGIGIKKVWQASYPSGEAQTISSDLTSYDAISLTKDSEMLAAVKVDNVLNLWTVPIGDAAPASPVTTDTDMNGAPSWTPDGRIVFVKSSGDWSDLYIVDSRGGSPKQLTTNSRPNFSPVVSPDGRYIVFTSNRTGTPSLWRIDIDGSNPKQLTTKNDYAQSISPDGREVIYYSDTNKNTIWKVSIDGGEPVQLTDQTSSNPEFSPDGKQFVCFYQDDPKADIKIAILASNGGRPIKSFAVPKGFGAGIRWMPDGRSIVYGVHEGGVTNLWAQPVDGSAPKQITNFTSDLIAAFDFSRDGKQIALARGNTTRDVVLITGFKR